MRRFGKLAVFILVASVTLWAQSESTSNPAGAKAKRVRLSAGVAQQNLIHKVVPPYPREAKEIRLQGAVVLNAIIDAQGRIAELTAVSGRKELVPTAVEAVRQWRYRPFTLQGEPIEVETSIIVNFTLAPENSNMSASH